MSGRLHGYGEGPPRPFPASVATTGAPWDNPARETKLRRLIVQALAHEACEPTRLDEVAVHVLIGLAPAEAAGAVEAARSVLLAERPDYKRLRLQLAGAIAVPGWRWPHLLAIGRSMSRNAGGIDSHGAFAALREFCEGAER